MRKDVTNGLQNLLKTLNDNFKKLQKPVPPPFVGDPNDLIDKMLAETLLKLGIDIKITRMGGGYYMFGQKKIYCKIINGKLVVRVGGGYLGIEEFIQMYGKSEMDKDKNEAAKKIEEDIRNTLEKKTSGMNVTSPSKKK